MSPWLTGEQTGFVLDFHFSKNDFFSNAVLSKTYHMAKDVEDAVLVGRCRLSLSNTS